VLPEAGPAACSRIAVTGGRCVGSENLTGKVSARLHDLHPTWLAAVDICKGQAASRIATPGRRSNLGRPRQKKRLHASAHFPVCPGSAGVGRLYRFTCEKCGIFFKQGTHGPYR
jgi:hypothetical protein